MAKQVTHRITPVDPGYSSIIAWEAGEMISVVKPKIKRKGKKHRNSYNKNS